MGFSLMKVVGTLAGCLLLVLAFSAPIASWTSPALACGGPAGYDLYTPMSIASVESQITEVEDGYESYPRDEFLFLYPFSLVPEYRQAVKQLWKVAYDNYDGPEPLYDQYHNPLPRAFPSPSMDKFDDALSMNDLEAAGKEAKAIVEEVLDMPATSADGCQDELKRAVEFLEIKPLIMPLDPEDVIPALNGNAGPGELEQLPEAVRDALKIRDMQREDAEEFMKEHPGNPRTPTLRFVALQEKFKREIPDGYVEQIRKWVPASKWRELEGLADGWLKDYPDHPLADLVKLWKNRIYYFEGRDDLAWKNMLEIYPRRLPRVLYEMRFWGGGVPDSMMDSIKDPVLLTASMPVRDMTQENWAKWWKLSEKDIDKPWAVNLQERLLNNAFGLIKPGSLPDCYPEAPKNPTELWGELRTVGLMKAGKWDAVKEEIFSLKQGWTRTLLATSYYIRQGDLVAAAEVEGIDGSIDPSTGEYTRGMPEFKSYLIKVLIDDEGLKRLEASKDKTTREEALYTGGVRLAAAGRWGEAARMIDKTEPGQAALWRQVDRLSRDKSRKGLLTLARYFKDHNGELFYGLDNAWYRTLSGNYIFTVAKPDVRFRYETEDQAKDRVAHASWNKPWPREKENEGIVRDLTCSEMWLALQVYVKWLETARPSPEMKKVVREADVCYNWLLARDRQNSDFWEQYLKDKPVVGMLRKAGRLAKVNYQKEKPKPEPQGFSTRFIQKMYVPEDVKREWKAVRFAIQDMRTGVKTEQVVDVGKTVQVLDTGFTLTVTAYLPDYTWTSKGDPKMSVRTSIISSASVEPNRPVVWFVLEEKGKEPVKRALFEKEKYQNTYENQLFKMTLLEGIRTK